MTATLAENTAVPFHIGLTETFDATTLTGNTAVEGAYDAEEQMWKLPTGTTLTDPVAAEHAFAKGATFTLHHVIVVDDIL